MLMPKFKCSFKITATVDKTYIITNYEVDLSDEECNPNGKETDQAIKDSITDRILEDINTGDLQLVESGKLVETDYDDYPEFITKPTEVVGK